MQRKKKRRKVKVCYFPHCTQSPNLSDQIWFKYMYFFFLSTCIFFNLNIYFLIFLILQCCVGFCHTTMQISLNYTFTSSQSKTGFSVLHRGFSPLVPLTPNSICMLMLLSPFVSPSPSPTVSTYFF